MRAGGRAVARASIAPPGLRERRHGSLARRLVAVRRAADVPVVTARPHPGLVCWRNWYLENATHDHAVL
jgi:hypothetical protein